MRGLALEGKVFLVQSAITSKSKPIFHPAVFCSDALNLSFQVPKEKHRSLNIGSGANPKLNMTNLDKLDLPGVDIRWDLEKKPLPIEDSSVVVVASYMVLEHITNLLQLGEELWRISTPNALHYHFVPWWSSYRSWGDPTHVRTFADQSWSFWSKAQYEKQREEGSNMGQYRPAMDFNVLMELLFVVDTMRGKSEDELNFACTHLANVVTHQLVVLQAVK